MHKCQRVSVQRPKLKWLLRGVLCLSAWHVMASDGPLRAKSKPAVNGISHGRSVSTACDNAHELHILPRTVEIRESKGFSSRAFVEYCFHVSVLLSRASFFSSPLFFFLRVFRFFLFCLVLCGRSTGTAVSTGEAKESPEVLRQGCYRQHGQDHQGTTRICC